MKFIQITAVIEQPYRQPNEEWCWGSTTIYALDDSGQVYRLVDGDVQWYKLPTKVAE